MIILLFNQINQKHYLINFQIDSYTFNLLQKEDLKFELEITKNIEKKSQKLNLK